MTVTKQQFTIHKPCLLDKTTSETSRKIALRRFVSRKPKRNQNENLALFYAGTINFLLNRMSFIIQASKTSEKMYNHLISGSDEKYQFNLKFKSHAQK